MESVDEGANVALKTLVTGDTQTSALCDGVEEVKDTGIKLV
jgi:hypothetical protein